MEVINRFFWYLPAMLFCPLLLWFAFAAEPVAAASLDPRFQEFDGTGSLGETSLSTLATGTCIYTDGNYYVDEVFVMDCAGEHEFQFVGRYELSADGTVDYPGSPRIDLQAYDGCEPVFEAFTGEVFWDSQRDIVTVAPAPSTWADGDRTVHCLAYAPSNESNDIDNDGVPDNIDAFPNNPNESTDTDGDLIGNNADPDDDNDGFSDAAELAAGTDPLDANSRPQGNPVNPNQEAIPTLSQWAVILLALMLLMYGTLSLRRRYRD